MLANQRGQIVHPNCTTAALLGLTLYFDIHYHEGYVIFSADRGLLLVATTAYGGAKQWVPCSDGKPKFDYCEVPWDTLIDKYADMLSMEMLRDLI